MKLLDVRWLHRNGRLPTQSFLKAARQLLDEQVEVTLARCVSASSTKSHGATPTSVPIAELRASVRPFQDALRTSADCDGLVKAYRELHRWIQQIPSVLGDGHQASSMYDERTYMYVCWSIRVYACLCQPVRFRSSHVICGSIALWFVVYWLRECFCCSRASLLRFNLIDELYCGVQESMNRALFGAYFTQAGLQTTVSNLLARADSVGCTTMDESKTGVQTHPSPAKQTEVDKEREDVLRICRCADKADTSDVSFITLPGFTNVEDVVDVCGDDATAFAEEKFGYSPAIERLCRVSGGFCPPPAATTATTATNTTTSTEKGINVVAPYLYFTLMEVLKNSLVATAERYGTLDIEDAPPIQVRRPSAFRMDVWPIHGRVGVGESVVGIVTAAHTDHGKHVRRRFTTCTDK